VYEAICVHADSLFTSLGDSACTECSSGIEASITISVKDCTFEKGSTAPASPYIRSARVTAVKLEGNTFEVKPKMFEVTDPGALSAPNFLL
jgi:hypothetical protein